MGQRAGFTKALAAIGLLLAWMPLAAPLAFAVPGVVQGRPFQVDYLMPAELFPVALAGGGLLLWAALRARLRRALIASGLACSVGGLAAMMIVSVVTGLASGETEPTGWLRVVSIGLLAFFILALVMVAVSGALLARSLFTKRSP